jgi:hypothetical protein
MTNRLYLAVILMLGVCGCGVVSPLRNGSGSGSGGGGSTGGKLYVSTAGSILRFASALTANGNVAPEVIINGSSSQIKSPKRILLDTSTDRLFVANQGGGSVLIFSPASTATAGSAPSAVLTSTGNMVAPFDIAIDSGANLLYVADGKSILVFANESTLSGNVNTAPLRTMTVPFTMAAIFLDANNNLFIADPTDSAVNILQSASTQAGDVTLLLHPVAGTATTLTTPNGMALDSGGRLIVSNGGSSPAILLFTNLVVPGGADPGPAPAATIGGTSTLVGSPGQMVFNAGANSGELYVADGQAPGILIFTNINSVTGNIASAPARSIVGAGTQLNVNAVNGVALDTTR